MIFDIDQRIVAEEASKTALIILAAGLSRRFGSADKLAAVLDGAPLAHHILQTTSPLAFSQRILVCAASSIWQEAYRNAGFKIIHHHAPELGLGFSLHLGAKAVQPAQQALICLADMPLISRSHIERMLEASHSGVGAIIATRSANYAGPPAILPLPVLLSLPVSGEGGARSVIRTGAFVETELATTHDVDSPSDLLLAAELLSVQRR